MIAQIRGTILEKGYDHVVVEVGGMGFRVSASLQTLSELGQSGAAAKLYTELVVREDALTLFGFATVEERTAFELLTSVQGIGPKMAMSVLSAMSATDLATAVKSEDLARLKKIPGVGMKTAERMVLELRDKLDKAGLTARAPERPAQPKVEPQRSAQVASALVNLGYKPAEAERAAESIAAEAAALPIAELVKRALRALAE